MVGNGISNMCYCDPYPTESGNVSPHTLHDDSKALLNNRMFLRGIYQLTIPHNEVNKLTNLLSVYGRQFQDFLLS